MASLMDHRRRILLGAPHLETKTGKIANFKTDIVIPYKELMCSFLPIQAGTGDPSPTNVRSISGRSGLSLKHCRKNLISATVDDVKTCGASANWSWSGNIGTRGNATVEIQTDSNGKIIGLLGSNTAESGSQSIDMPLPISLAGQTLTLTGCPSGGGSSRYRLLVQEFAPENQVHARQYGNPVTFTFPEATDVRARMVFQSGYNNVLFQPMLTFDGETDQTYEPYQGETIPISLPIAYGGSVDLATGELVREYVLFEFDGSEPWIAYGGSNAAAMRYTLWLEDISGSSIYGARTTAMCSHFQIMTGNGVFGTLRYSPTSTRDDHSATYIAVNDSGKTQFGGSRDAFTAWLKDQYDNSTPVQLLAKLVTPVATSITPQTIKAFKGINNIWSDAGDVTIKFWTH